MQRGLAPVEGEAVGRTGAASLTLGVSLCHHVGRGAVHRYATLTSGAILPLQAGRMSEAKMLLHLSGRVVL